MASKNEEKRETSADIADEIRRAVESMGDGMPYTVSAGTMRRVADRIEAAAKRQEKTYLDQIRDAMNMWGHEKHIAKHAQKPTVGNAAAMCEALVSLRALIADEPDGTPMIYAMKAAIDAALSAPPRTCDVGTVKEQSDRFAEFCKKHDKGCGLGYGSKGIGHPKVTCPAFKDMECAIVWSQMPYEAKEGGAA